MRKISMNLNPMQPNVPGQDSGIMMPEQRAPVFSVHPSQYEDSDITNPMVRIGAYKEHMKNPEISFRFQKYFECLNGEVDEDQIPKDTIQVIDKVVRDVDRYCKKMQRKFGPTHAIMRRL